MSSSDRPRSFLIDAPIYFFRGYFAIPDHFHTPNGDSVNGVLGFSKSMMKIAAESPDFVVAAFDESLGTCYRNEIYPDYKSSRPPATDDILFQMDCCQQICEYLGFTPIAHYRYEADDLLASVRACLNKSKALQNKNLQHVVVTRDKDLGQIVGEGDMTWDPAEEIWRNYSEVTEKLGIAPHRFPELQALMGDPVDDIPGLPGVGPKTAGQVMQHYSSIEALLKDPDKLLFTNIRGAKSVVEKIKQYKELVIISYQLALLLDTAELESTKAKSYEWEGIDVDGLIKYWRKLGLPRTLETQLNNLFDE